MKELFRSKGAGLRHRPNPIRRTQLPCRGGSIRSSLYSGHHRLTLKRPDVKGLTDARLSLQLAARRKCRPSPPCWAHSKGANDRSIDLQRKDQQSIENLYKRKLLQKNHVLTFADFTGTTEADIEDMFDVAFYLKLVNAEYANDLSKKPKASDVKAGNPRILVRLEAFLGSNPLKGTARFNHFRPARYFTEKISPRSGSRFLVRRWTVSRRH